LQRRHVAAPFVEFLKATVVKEQQLEKQQAKHDKKRASKKDAAPTLFVGKNTSKTRKVQKTAKQTWSGHTGLEFLLYFF
jgi:hypothetical protein